MFDFLGSLLDTSGFPPRWRCGVWTPGHGWLHVLSDLGVWSAYMAIPAVLGYFVARKRGVPFRGVFLLFTAFILACGTTHLMEAAIFWWPAYRLAGALKLLTAGVSWVTVVALVRVAPEVLAMRTPAELEREVAARRAAEAELGRANAELERRVRERTEELEQSNAALCAERERFRTTLASIGDAVIATDTAGRVTFLNPTAEALTGWPAAEAAGADLGAVFRIVHETTRVAVENPAVRALRDGVTVGMANHTVLLARDAREWPIDDCAAPIRDAAGGVAGAVLVFRDVTAERRAEVALRASEERFRAFMHHSPAAAWLIDPDGRVEYVSEGYRRTFKLPAGELVGRAVADLHPPAAAAAILGNARRVAATGQVLTVTETGVRADGTVGEFLVHKFPVPAPGGRRLVGAVATDVTEIRAAETALRSSQERLEMALSAGGLGTFDWDVVSGRVAWSRSHYDLFGYDSGDPFPVEFRHFRGGVHPDDWPRVEATIRAAMVARTTYEIEHRVVRPDGTERWAAATGRFHYDPAGQAVRMVGVIQDVTARRRAEEELRLRDRAIRAVAGGILIADAARPDQPAIYVSPGFERLTGYTAAEVLGRNCRFLQGPGTDPETVARLRAAVAAARPWEGELLNYRKDGTPFWNELRVSPVRDEGGRLTHFIGVQSDVTGRRRLEDQLRQAQKLEAVGRLAGGVAHDFNNLLTVVNGCGELLLTELPVDAPARPLVEDVVRAGERGAALTRQLLAFSRQQMLRAEVFDPSQVLAETAKLLARLLGEDVTLRTALDPAAGCVRGDVGQVEQVVINLAVNGRDAMPRGGTLTVETAPAAVGDADLALSPDARPGRYVRIAVTDTGTGMPPEVQARLFEPFFTTKGVGKGTGLGLATVYGIVRQSGGFLTVRSAVGAGTTVAAYLPRHEAEPGGSKSALSPKPRAGGGEAVLVVEDDDAVRALTSAVLARQGYRVEAAESGAAALAACDRLPAPPDLLLTDVVMPGMSGRELAEALTARYPRLRVAFLSGYTADAVLRHGVEEERVAFLQKPYTPDALARFVRAVLDGATKPG